MRAAALGMVLLCGIAQGAEPSDADRPPGKDRKTSAVSGLWPLQTNRWLQPNQFAVRPVWKFDQMAIGF